MTVGSDPPPLAAQRCAPCSGRTPLVSAGELARGLAELDPDWRVEPEPQRLVRVVGTADFAQAFALATRVALHAEAVGHHPDLLVRWGSLRVEIWTHAAGGITHSDLVLAAHVDTMAPTAR